MSIVTASNFGVLLLLLLRSIDVDHDQRHLRVRERCQVWCQCIAQNLHSGAL